MSPRRHAHLPAPSAVVVRLAALAAVAVLVGCSQGGSERPAASGTDPQAFPKVDRRVPDPPARQGARFPDARTTGVPRGTALAVVGTDLMITTPGAVIDGKDVRDCVTVAADDVTIRRSRINCDSWYAIRNFSGGRAPRNLLVEDVEISCGRGLGFRAVAFSNYTARRVAVHGCEDGFHASDDVVVEDSFVHDLVTGPGAHNDGIQSDGGHNITIRHNTIENRYDQTSAVLMSTNTSRISDVVVEDNLLAGGGYTLYAGTTGGGPVSGMRVLDNRFSRKFFPDGGHFGPVTGLGGGSVWSGNVWDDTGQPVPP